MLGPSALSAAKNCGEEQRVREGHKRTPHHTEHRLGTKLFVMILVNLLGWWWWQVPASWMCRYVRYKHTHTTLPTKRSPRESIEHRLVGGKPVDVDGQVVISSHSASAAVYDSSHQRASLPSLLVDEAGSREHSTRWPAPPHTCHRRRQAAWLPRLPKGPSYFG